MTEDGGSWVNDDHDDVSGDDIDVDGNDINVVGDKDDNGIKVWERSFLVTHAEGFVSKGELQLVSSLLVHHHTSIYLSVYFGGGFSILVISPVIVGVKGE